MGVDVPGILAPAGRNTRDHDHDHVLVLVLVHVPSLVLVLGHALVLFPARRRAPLRPVLDGGRVYSGRTRTGRTCRTYRTRTRLEGPNCPGPVSCQLANAMLAGWQARWRSPADGSRKETASGSENVSANAGASAQIDGGDNDPGDEKMQMTGPQTMMTTVAGQAAL